MSGSDCSIIRTGDATATLFCAEYKQTMHSDSGAFEEAVNMHVLPSGVIELPGDSITVLDVGFGLGYNVLALLLMSLSRVPAKKITVFSLERDREFAQYIHGIEFGDERDDIYGIIKSAYADGGCRSGSFSLEFLFGDARDSVVRSQCDQFDAVFHDPFSPGMNPELWTVDFFTALLPRMKDGARLTTYSSAVQVRAALVAAGFSVARGPSFGRKKEGTIARKGKLENSLDGDFIPGMCTEIRATPYRDPGLCCTREDIVFRRLEEMRDLRSRACRQALRE